MEWSREQEIVALYMYCLIPFNKVSGTNPYIVKMAKIIGRPNANSLKAKIGNFGKYDTNLAAVGLGHSSHLDEDIWNEYYCSFDENGQLTFESNNVHDNGRGEDCYKIFTWEELTDYEKEMLYYVFQLRTEKRLLPE